MNKTFLEDVLPPEGCYALFIRRTKSHLWFDTIAAMNAEVERRTAAGERDVYFATASYKDDSARSQTNVRQLKALRLDIDAGEHKFAKHPDGAYATRDEAIKAVVEFSIASKLVPTWIISSGEGVHVYYTLQEAVGPNVWNVLASRLEALVEKHGLKADSTTTTDSARVLRPIGSVHTSGAEVKVLRTTGRTYTPESFTALTPEPTRVKPSAKALSINDEASSFVGPPKDMLKIVSRCKAVNEIAKVRGNVQEPAWRAMLGIAKHCSNGHKLAHMLSDGHPEYDYDETEQKLQAWNAGPTTCSQFDKSLGKCDGCQYNGRIKSPITLGEMTVEEIRGKQPKDETEPEPATTGKIDIIEGVKKLMPEGFTIKRRNGRNWLIAKVPVETENEAGDKVEVIVDVPLTTGIFWVSNWSVSTSKDDTSGTTICTYINGTVREYEMDMSTILDPRKLSTVLAGHTVLLEGGPKIANLASEYMRRFVEHILESNMREKITERFGLRYDNNGNLGSAHGKYVIHEDGRVTTAALGSSIRKTGNEGYVVRPMPFKPEGSWTHDEIMEHVVPSAKWHADFLRRHYGEKAMSKFQLAIMFGLASPLMAFVGDEYLGGSDLPPQGLTVSLYSSGSGMGKTAAADCAIAAYGDPTKLVAPGSDATATVNARMQVLEEAGTNPVLLDEAGETSPTNAANLIKTIGNGRGKIRVKNNGEKIPGKTWALICLITTNRPQRELVSADTETTDAVQTRMLEMDVDDTPHLDRDRVAMFNREKAVLLREHAGALGFMVQYAIAVVGRERISKLVETIRESSTVLAAENKSSRFQWRGMLAVEVMVELLKRFEIELFDMDVVRATFDEAYEAAKEYTKAVQVNNSPAEVMSRFLNDIRGETVVTYNWSHRNTGSIDIILNRPGLKISARHSKAMGQTFVSKRRFDEWAAQNRLSARVVYMNIKKAGLLVKMYRSDSDECFISRRDPLSGTAESNSALVSGFTVDMHALQAALGERLAVEYDEAAQPQGDSPNAQATLQ